MNKKIMFPLAQGGVSDVQVNGASIVADGVANVLGATSAQIKNGADDAHPLMPQGQHAATFYGLAKAAGSDEKDSTLPLGQYTEDAKSAIQKMLGITKTLTVTAQTRDGVMVTGQTVTVANLATGQVFATAAYNGQPVTFALPTGFAFDASISNTLVGHFSPNRVQGIVSTADISAIITYSDFSDIHTADDIKAALDADIDLTDLVGRSITCGWRGNTLEWDIVDYDTANDDVTLLLHDTLPDQMVFEPIQALAYFENGLAAGDYSFKNGSTSYYFTLTKAIPNGGQLAANTTSFTTYESQDATAAFETGTVSTTEITGAVELGTCGTESGTYPLNHFDRAQYGSNNFKESALFWWLNADASANTPVPRTNKFARAYSYSIAGFLNGLDADFLANIADTEWKCSTNNVYEAPASMGGTCIKQTPYTVTAKFALASEKEIFGSYSGTNAGDRVLGLFDGATAEERIKYYNNQARVWWLRSPVWDDASNERVVYTSGAVNYYYARSAYGVVPACKIKKSA